MIFNFNSIFHHLFLLTQNQLSTVGTVGRGNGQGQGHGYCVNLSIGGFGGLRISLANALCVFDI